MKIAYFGIDGSFTHTAASELFSQDEFIGAPTFEEVFELLVNGSADRAVVPIENTLAGSIYENYDLLEANQLCIVAETYLRVEHFLQSAGTTLKDITRVISHPKALEQCSEFFRKHPDIKKEAFSDTASAAKYVSTKTDPTIAVIAGKNAAEIYNLNILAENLEDNTHNFTRFLVIARDEAMQPKHANKCSILVRLAHVPGSLRSVFGIIANANFNLTKIESRPIHDKPFEYLFYLDFTFDPKTSNLNEVFEGLKNNLIDLRLLGIYQDARDRQSIR